VILLVSLVQRRYLLPEGIRHRVLLLAVTVQGHEREEPVGAAVFEFAIGKPGSRPNLIQSAALGSASYRLANVCAAKVPRSFGNIDRCFSHA
jgi:hypothetical protein